MSRTVDLVVIGAGAVGENVADCADQGGLSVAHRRERAGRRRVLLLGLHAVEGAAARGRRAACRQRTSAGPSRPSPASSTSPPVLAPPRLVHERLERTTARSSGSRAPGSTWSAGTVGSPASARSTVTAADGSTTVLTAHARRRRLHRLAPRSCPTSPGSRDAKPWTSREATSAQTLPASLAFLGGGVVAVEMATAYAALGADVTLVARSGLLGDEEPFAGELVAGLAA